MLQQRSLQRLTPASVEWCRNVAEILHPQRSISVKNHRIDNLKVRFSSLRILVFRSFIEKFLESMGMEKFFQGTLIHGSDSLFILFQFPFLKTAARPFVPEISIFECKRILFHSITDIDATTGPTLKKVQKSDFFLCFGKSTVSLLILGEMLRFEENSSAKCTSNNPINFQIDRSNGSCGPIDQNLEKIQGTSFSYLSQRNLLKNEKIQFLSTV
ncbi:hypothetical protein PV328_008447 [Microctonus aethiopoides]|uniref:Uncharacterized protein n=1 Tax=Microctonus aethiopoides TaxID=144406 RepID=A0AA39FJT7_9HYME|nr:hypothetical protein PV328_008447 [Microctonus aethiopoides]